MEMQRAIGIQAHTPVDSLRDQMWPSEAANLPNGKQVPVSRPEKSRVGSTPNQGVPASPPGAVKTQYEVYKQRSSEMSRRRLSSDQIKRGYPKYQTEGVLNRYLPRHNVSQQLFLHQGNRMPHLHPRPHKTEPGRANPQNHRVAQQASISQSPVRHFEPRESRASINITGAACRNSG